MKEQNETTTKEFNTTKISNIRDEEFKDTSINTLEGIRAYQRNQKNASMSWKTEHWKATKLKNKKKKSENRSRELSDIKYNAFTFYGSQKEKEEKGGQKTHLKK